MYNGFNVEFVKDRFGRPNSAIRFSDGYYQIPPGIYFKGDFTIAVWLKLNVYSTNTILLDFGNGLNTERVLLRATYNEQSILSSLFITFADVGSFFYSSLDSPRGQWVFLVATLSGTTGSLYLNGILAGQANNMNIPRNIYRKSNFIGKDNWDNVGYLWSDLDDFRIYEKALCQSEIYDLMYYTSDSNKTNVRPTTTSPISTTTNKPLLPNPNLK